MVFSGQLWQPNRRVALLARSPAATAPSPLGNPKESGITPMPKVNLPQSELGATRRNQVLRGGRSGKEGRFPKFQEPGGLTSR